MLVMKQAENDIELSKLVFEWFSDCCSLEDYKTRLRHLKHTIEDITQNDVLPMIKSIVEADR